MIRIILITMMMFSTVAFAKKPAPYMEGREYTYSTSYPTVRVTVPIRQILAIKEVGGPYIMIEGGSEVRISEDQIALVQADFREAMGFDLIYLEGSGSDYHFYINPLKVDAVEENTDSGPDVWVGETKMSLPTSYTYEQVRDLFFRPLPAP